MKIKFCLNILLLILMMASALAIPMGTIVEDHRGDKFKVLGQIGKGGYGKVYKAKDMASGKYFALKELFYDGQAALDILRSYKFVHMLSGKEAESFIDVRSLIMENTKKKLPNMIITELAQSDMHQRNLEYHFKESSSETVVVPDGKVEWTEILKVGNTVLKSIEVLQMHDYVHQDIKPENILIVGKQYKLADFDFVGKLENSSVHTKSFMSPEQAFKLPVSNASDLYSLGVALYELSFGKLPYSLSYKVRSQQTTRQDFKSDATRYFEQVQQNFSEHLTLLENIEREYQKLEKSASSKSQKKEIVLVKELVIALMQFSPNQRFIKVKGLLKKLAKKAGGDRVRFKAYNAAEEKKVEFLLKRELGVRDFVHNEKKRKVEKLKVLEKEDTQRVSRPVVKIPKGRCWGFLQIFKLGLGT